MNGKIRREKERLRRRKEILSAARSVFSRKGYHNATLDEIARKAQLGKGTVYWYFASKAELFLAVLQAGGEEQFLRVKRASEKQSNCRSRIEAVAREVLGHLARNQYVTHILFSEVVFTTQEMKREMDRFIRDKYKVYSKLVEDIFREGIAAGEIRRVDAKKSSHMLLSIFHSFACYWRFEGVKPRPDEDARVVCRMLFGGLEKQR